MELHIVTCCSVCLKWHRAKACHLLLFKISIRTSSWYSVSSKHVSWAACLRRSINTPQTSTHLLSILHPRFSLKKSKCEIHFSMCATCALKRWVRLLPHAPPLSSFFFKTIHKQRHVLLRLATRKCHVFRSFSGWAKTRSTVRTNTCLFQHAGTTLKLRNLCPGCLRNIRKVEDCSEMSCVWEGI